MTEYLASLSSYFSTGAAAVTEKVMIWFFVAWLIWCVRLYLLPNDDVKPTMLNAQSSDTPQGDA